jgi:hypothetical protein
MRLSELILIQVEDGNVWQARSYRTTGGWQIKALAIESRLFGVK